MRRPCRRTHHLSPSLVLGALLTVSGCADAPPLRILNAHISQQSDDTSGPLRWTAEISGGEGALRATIYVTTSDSVQPLSSCGEPPGLDLDRISPPASDGGLMDAGEMPDAQIPDAQIPDASEEANPSCFRIEMRALGGGAFQGDLQGPPFPRGTTLRYLIEARDGEGRRALWPEGAPEALAEITLGPSGSAPAPLAIAPARGPASGGTPIIIRGDGLSPDMELWLGDEGPLPYTLVSEHLVESTAPGGAAGPADLTLRRAGLEATLPGAFTYEAPPEILAVVPAEGPTIGGTFIVVEGRGFREGDALEIGGRPAVEVDRLDDTRLIATIPPGEAGLVDVEVLSVDGQQGRLPEGFTYWPPPQLEALQPTVGPDFGGTLITLEGADMRAPGAVLIGEVPCEDVTVSEGGQRATCLSGGGAGGIFDVVFINPDGQLDTLPAAWRYFGPPSIESIDPSRLARCGPTEITLRGQNFVEDSVFLFNGVAAEIIEISPAGDEARLRVPPGEPGPILIEIINPDGRRAQAGDLADYGIRPVITAVEPREHPIWGGTVALIEGGDLERGAQITVDGVAAEAVQAIEVGCDAQFSLIVPPGEAGPADVELTNPDGGQALAVGAVEYIAPSVSPDEGLTPGYTNVTLTGLDLRAGLDVRLNGARPRSLTQIDEETWLLTTPAGPRGPVELSVFNVDGRGGRLPGAFTYRAFDDDGGARLDAEGDCNDVLTADVNGDGADDLVVANGAIAQVGTIEQSPTVHYGDGDGGFESVRLQPPGNGMNVSLGDLEGDGDLDLLVTNLSSASNTFFRNNSGRFEVDRSVPVGGPSYDGALIDIDLDGDVDLFLLNTGDPDNGNVDGPETMRLNVGRGDLGEDVSDRVYFSRGDVHDHDVEFGDINGDGVPDAVIVVDNLSNSFQTAENRLLIGGPRAGELDYGASPFNRLIGDWLHAEMADLDGDGDLDVLLPQDYIDSISLPDQPALGLFFNDGAGNFSPEHQRNRGLPPIAAFESVSTDLDEDGDLDILIAGYGVIFQNGQIEEAQSYVLLNDGTANFFDGSAAFIDQTPVAAADFAVIDVDGDGRGDLFECAARGRSRIWLRR